MSAVSRDAAARFGDWMKTASAFFAAKGLGRPGLEQERCALRARRDQVRPLDAVARTHVVDLVDLVEVGVDPGLAVLQQGVLLPGALPQLVGDVDVLVCPRVARVVCRQALVTEVAGGVGQVVRDDVPRDPALAGVVQCADPAGEVERVLLQDRGRERDAEVLGRVGDGAGQHRRVVARDLQAGLEVLARVAAVVGVQPDDVGEEDRVELPSLERPREVDPVVEAVEVALAGGRAAPGALDDVAGRVHHERGEVEWARWGLWHGALRGSGGRREVGSRRPRPESPEQSAQRHRQLAVSRRSTWRREASRVEHDAVQDMRDLHLVMAPSGWRCQERR
jgi:hypothetical protein